MNYANINNLTISANAILLLKFSLIGYFGNEYIKESKSQKTKAKSNNLLSDLEHKF